ncbi:MAG: arabinan endo-1,5-alpha-L-arabinosidase [Candidatus Onthomonas sp.]
MDGILQLNELDPIANAPFGSHDPSMLWDPVTKLYYSYATDVYMPRHGLEVRIGIPVRTSPDLVHFTYRGTVLSETAIAQGRDNGSFPPTVSFWAPFVEYVHGEYRMYYSATRAFGSSESRIWLATASHPLGPFENRGVVADTWGADNSLPNAIDPHILRTPEGVWLVYGSFFGGIFLKALDDRTGLSLEAPQALGRCISHKMPPPALDGPEGASVLFCPDTGYYYLFQSYGWLGDGYDIRVGRSRAPEGPYLDDRGRDLAGEALGIKLAGSYCFSATAPNARQDRKWRWAGFRGLGHGVPFYDPARRQYFFVHHVRDGARCFRSYDPVLRRYSYRYHYLMIRPMFFLDNGWPVLGPEPFAGEDPTPVPLPETPQTWELIRLEDQDNDIRHSSLIRLSPGEPMLRHSVCHRCRDFENGGREILALTGLDENGCAYWGKQNNTTDFS